ncbi:MAG: orotate phosphoribosyltransferase [Chloroflexota bacterium]
MTTIRKSIEASARAAIAARTEELFRRSGALREGHFQLKSGRHSTAYLEKFLVLQDPAATSELCSFWAAEHGAPGTADVDLVAGPTTGGVILAFETARQLGTRGIFAEEVRDAAGATKRAFRRGFEIARGEKVLLVDDILTTGGSLLAMLPAVEALGGEIVGCHVLVDRSGQDRQTLTSPTTGRVYPLSALWRFDLPTFDGGDDCPACRAGVPLHAPGSTGTDATAASAAGPAA